MENKNGLGRNVRETVFVFRKKNLTGLRRGMVNHNIRVDESYDGSDSREDLSGLKDQCKGK